MQGGHPEQLLHQLFRLYAPLQVDGQLQAAQVGFIAHIGNFFDFARLDDFRHLIHDDFRSGGVGNLGDFNEIPLFFIVPLGAKLKAAPASGVHFPGGCLVKQQLCAGGEIRARQGFQNIMVRILHQGDGSITDLFQIKGADIAGHAHGDALVGRHQHIGEGGGQQTRLFHGGIVVVHHVHSVAVDVPEQLGTDAVQLCFGIPGGGVSHVSGIDLTKVALGIHKGMQQRFVAPCQTHHGLVNGRIAMGVQPHGLTHNVCRLGPSAGEQPHLIHGVQQLPVRGLEAVNLRDGTGHNHGHCIGHIIEFQRFRNGLLGGGTNQAHNAIGIHFFLFFGFLFFLCHVLLPHIRKCPQVPDTLRRFPR